LLDKDTVPKKTIATLPISGFVPSEERVASDWNEIRGEIGKILSTVANADALLMDLRGNHGGSPHTVSFILSYLLDNGPIHITDFVDRDGKIDESFSTLPIDELPAGTSAFGGVKPIWVLTDKETVSAGEGMAYDLQAFKRSNAVIGEGKTTAGAANPITNPRFICEEIFGKGWWLVAVPSVKPVHAVTGTNWEGVGVISDIVAGSGEWEGVDALEVGRRLAKVALQAEEPQEEL
jgi:C-terminal processing protease CtpA/Prc